MSLLPWWQARLGGTGETELSGAPSTPGLTEYGFGVTLEAITLPSSAAGCRLSKIETWTLINTTHGWTETPQKCPLSILSLLFVRSYVVYMFDRQKHFIFLHLSFFEIVFLCSMIRNCFNRTNHSYVSSQKKTAANFCPVGFCTGINTFGERNWQLWLQNLNDAATFPYNWHANTAQAHWITDVNINIFKDL